ncbi:cephalosporin-C deacetylase-like acetyl esterase [Anaerotaenia torta]|uniref:acetylxylan esterase n=1 Tax=Anaerotaenia torta TaxID=433293 RepID=UPI003D2445A0
MNQKDIDLWVEAIRKEGERPCIYREEYMDPFSIPMYIFQSIGADRFVRIESEGYDPFYCYFQPCFNKSAPLIVHTPGYGGEMSMHPELAQYFHVLHINPLGYTTPKGKDVAKMTMNGVGSVLPDTFTSGAKKGYFTWLVNCVMAVRWALSQENVLPDRVSFFGTSQGGGAAMLLGSVFQDITRAVASDQPFLTNFAMAGNRGAYAMGRELYEAGSRETARAEYLMDTIHHVHRFTFPVLLTSGGRDETCPPETIADLFDRIKGTKSYTHFEDLPHGYNREFVQMAKAWFLIYA